MTPGASRQTLAACAIATTFLCGACAARGAKPQPFPHPADRGASPPPFRTTSPDYSAIIATAMDLRGVPYKDGGADPAGFDCSGFTRYVFARHGLPLPRSVRDQFAVGRSVPGAQVVPGDLVFFATTARSASHVGIVVADDTFIHAPSSAGAVRVERISARYWRSRFVGVRRVMEE
jgi:cell wall-associated NlpC family hydrolase